jgi:RNA polymerase sigma-70 factor (ECF subfamily)
MRRRGPLTAAEPDPPPGREQVDARLEALVRDYGQLLRQIIRKFVPPGSGVDPDEIEQEVRIRLWRALERETDLRHAASYIYRVAATATIDAIRRIRARREEQLPRPEDGQHEATPDSEGRFPDQTAIQHELMAAVRASLRELSTDRRRAVSLHLQGFTNLETAELLGWSEPKARNLIYRGLRDLRAALRRRGIDYAPDV